MIDKSKKKTVLMIRNVPSALRDRFKVWCAYRRVSMQATMLQLIKDKMKETDDYDEQEQIERERGPKKDRNKDKKENPIRSKLKKKKYSRVED